MTRGDGSFPWLVWAAKRPEGCPQGSAYAVLVALAEHADSEGVCWPGLDRLAAITGWSRSTVRRSVEALERAGLIDVGRESGTASRYQITPPHLCQGDMGRGELDPCQSDTGVCQDDTGPVSERHGTRVTVTPEQPKKSPENSPPTAQTPPPPHGGGEPELQFGEPAAPSTTTAEPKSKRRPAAKPKAYDWPPPEPYSDDAHRLAAMAVERRKAWAPKLRDRPDRWAAGIHAVLEHGPQVAKGVRRSDPTARPEPADVETALGALWTVYRPDRGFDWRDQITDGHSLWRFWRTASGPLLTLAARGGGGGGRDMRSLSGADQDAELEAARQRLRERRARQQGHDPPTKPADVISVANGTPHHHEPP